MVKLLIKRYLLVLVQLGIHDQSFLVERAVLKRLFVNQLENKTFLLKKVIHIIQNKLALKGYSTISEDTSSETVTSPTSFNNGKASDKKVSACSCAIGNS